MFTCVCMYMYMCLCLSVHGPRSMLGATLNHFSPLFCDRGVFHWVWCSLWRLDRFTSEPQKCLFCLPNTEMTGYVLPMHSTSCTCWGLSSNPQAYVACILPNEPCPQAPTIFLFFLSICQTAPQSPELEKSHLFSIIQKISKWSDKWSALPLALKKVLC